MSQRLYDGWAVDLKVKRLLSPETSTSVRSYIDEAELSVGECLPLGEHPEERLFYFLYGRGIMSIYEEFPEGDVYEARQDTAIWITPKIKHQIMNTGNYPLRYVVLMVTGGVAFYGRKPGSPSASEHKNKISSWIANANSVRNGGRRLPSGSPPGRRCR